MDLNYGDHLGKHVLFMKVKGLWERPHGAAAVVCSFRPFKGDIASSPKWIKQSTGDSGARNHTSSSSLWLTLHGLLCKLEVEWEFQGENICILKFKISHAPKINFTVSNNKVIKWKNILLFESKYVILCNLYMRIYRVAEDIFKYWFLWLKR